MAISKHDFILAVAAQAGVGTQQADAVLEAVADVAARQLVADGSVRVPGLVNIEAKHYGERPGRNLRTDEPCMVPAAVRIRVKTSAPLESKFKAAAAAAPAPGLA